MKTAQRRANAATELGRVIVAAYAVRTIGACDGCGRSPRVLFAYDAHDNALCASCVYDAACEDERKGGGISEAVHNVLGVSYRWARCYVSHVLAGIAGALDTATIKDISTISGESAPAKIDAPTCESCGEVATLDAAGECDECNNGGDVWEYGTCARCSAVGVWHNNAGECSRCENNDDAPTCPACDVVTRWANDAHDVADYCPACCVLIDEHSANGCDGCDDAACTCWGAFCPACATEIGDAVTCYKCHAMRDVPALDQKLSAASLCPVCVTKYDDGRALCECWECGTIANVARVQRLSIGDDVTAYLVEHTPDNDGVAASLMWGDGVANEWREGYPTTAAAWARFAVLVECGASEWARGFTTSPREFAEQWQAFANEAAQ